MTHSTKPVERGREGEGGGTHLGYIIFFTVIVMFFYNHEYFSIGADAYIVALANVKPLSFLSLFVLLGNTFLVSNGCRSGQSVCMH